MKPSGANGETPKGCFVDVGAHVGFFSLYAAALGHRVHAFEPAAKHVAPLKRSLELNGPDLRDRVTLHEKIAADRDGTMSISVFDIGPSGSSFAEVGGPPKPCPKGANPHPYVRWGRAMVGAPGAAFKSPWSAWPTL